MVNRDTASDYARSSRKFGVIRVTMPIAERIDLNNPTDFHFDRHVGKEKLKNSRQIIVKKGGTAWYPDCTATAQMAVAFLLIAAGAVAFGIWKLGRSLIALADEICVFCDADSEEPLPCVRETEPTKRERELPLSA
jgi:hypothetical protein